VRSLVSHHMGEKLAHVGKSAAQYSRNIAKSRGPACGSLYAVVEHITQVAGPAARGYHRGPKSAGVAKALDAMRDWAMAKAWLRKQLESPASP
jgi:hypothetical protein